PGFKGSRLVDEKGRIAWLTASQLLARRSPLRPLWCDHRPDYSGLRPDGVLDSVTLPLLPIGQRVYAPLLCGLQEQQAARGRILGMGWDWRQAPWRAAPRLDRLVQRAGDQGARCVHIVSHSLGALVAAWWLLYGDSTPEHPVRRTPGGVPLRWTVVTGAFGGSAKMFRVLQIGDQVARNRHLLDATTLAMFESSWVLLPRGGFVCDERSSPWPAPLNRIETWQKAGWRPFEADTADALPGIAAWAQSMMRQADAFYRLVEEGERPADLESVVNVISRQRATLHHVFAYPDGRLVLTAQARDAEPAFRGKSMSAPGDATLTTDAMQLPLPFREGAVVQRIDAEHVGILGSPNLLEAILQNSA
ncbi:MAG: hypothetical protein D6761_09115, partial [Candidatus Dadabacteria bacterium]